MSKINLKAIRKRAELFASANSDIKDGVIDAVEVASRWYASGKDVPTLLEFIDQVKDNLLKLDGSTESSVALMMGIPVEELDDVRGIQES